MAIFNRKYEYGLMRHNTSGFTGVSYDKHSNRWRVNISIVGKNTITGLVKSPEEGSILYQKLKQKMDEYELKKENYADIKDQLKRYFYEERKKLREKKPSSSLDDIHE